MEKPMLGQYGKIAMIKSRKLDSKNRRSKQHFCAQNSKFIDAFFAPGGYLEIHFLMDGRKYHVSFTKDQTKKLAKRLLKDTVSRGLELLGKTNEAS